MPDFNQELRNWQLFYSTVALASVTLAGLLFVSLPLLASLGLMAVSIAIWFGNMTAIFGLVVVVAALLASASWNAWLILVD
ncbi:MAG: hypothetical protein HY835_14520 [Anaerolineae bacterium]|nr:hypothetical protein [Anaerolineae bacterium]